LRAPQIATGSAGWCHACTGRFTSRVGGAPQSRDFSIRLRACAMKIIYKLLVVVLALIGELVVLEIGSEILFRNSHGEMVDTSFRRHERIAAFFDYHEHPSSATKATFDNEMRLMHRHNDWKLYLALSLFVVINGVAIYHYWNHGNQKTLA
jgi:hypothetical protein